MKIFEPQMRKNNLMATSIDFNELFKKPVLLV